MIAEQIDIRAEIGKVQKELLFFRNRFLPVFFDTPIDNVFEGDYADWVREKVDGPLSNWQKASRSLADRLPLGPLGSSTIRRDDFEEFLFQGAKPSFCVEEGRIVWNIGLFVDRSLCSAYCPSFSESALDNPARLPEVRRWLMSLPVDSPELANALCMVLPFIADADPRFAKLALDPETWRNIVLSDQDATDEERTKRLKWIDGLGFSHWVNNSLLHVLAALANNHFTIIEDFLDHPFLIGGYSHLFGHYIFAVLVEKVAILRQLAEERSELW